MSREHAFVPKPFSAKLTDIGFGVRMYVLMFFKILVVNKFFLAYVTFASLLFEVIDINVS